MSRWLGVGFGLRTPQLEALAARSREGLALPPVVELTVSHAFGRPERVDAIAERCALVLHDVFASLGTAGALDRPHLRRVAELARRYGAIDYSEHLAMTRSPDGLDLGHLVPLARTAAQLEVLIDHIHAVQDVLGLPVAVELPTTTLRLPGAELDEASFVRALIEGSGCELHLDLENLHIDACNHGRALVAPETELDAALVTTLERALHDAAVAPALVGAIARRLAGLPLAAVTRVHLAGGHVDASGWAVDSHRGPSSATSLAILVALRGHIDPRAIIIERDDRLPPVADLLAEAEAIHAIWAAG